MWWMGDASRQILKLVFLLKKKVTCRLNMVKITKAYNSIFLKAA